MLLYGAAIVRFRMSHPLLLSHPNIACSVLFPVNPTKDLISTFLLGKQNKMNTN